MYSLHVGLLDGELPTDRLFEYTDEKTRQHMRSHLAELQTLPVLAMPEMGDDRYEQVARVGNLVTIRAVGRNHIVKFVANPELGHLTMDEVERLAPALGIDRFEFRRTHLAVKDVDLFEILLTHQLSQGRTSSGNSRESGAVQFPVHLAREPSLVAVMMPFSKEFDVVYETIEQAAADSGLKIARADNIWDQHQVMQDVLGLIWQAGIVVADLTNRNTNVFYETGLAHALPRKTVLLTQDPDDVPFDLRSIRYLVYGVGTSDRAKLRKQLAERLTTLAAQPLL